MPRLPRLCTGLRTALCAAPLLLFALGCGGLGDETAPILEVTPSWNGEIQTLMASRCAICHKVPPENGAPTGFTFLKYTRAESPGPGQLDGAFEKRERILARAVQERSMPPSGATQPTAEERELLRKWIEGGAPQFPPDAPTIPSHRFEHE